MKPSAAARSSAWSRAFVPSPTLSPASCSRMEVRPTSSSDTRERCHCRSSASCSACRLLTGWANRVARLTNIISLLRMIRGLSQMKRYLEERLRLAREHGGEGLIAELVRVEMEGGRISANEMVSMVFLLLGAGSETTPT